MKVSLFSNNKVMLVGGNMTAFTSIKDSLSPSQEVQVFHSLEDLKNIASDEWYQCLKVGCIRNPYDLAVSLHFWYQQTIDPKSMTLSISVRNSDWKNIFIDSLDSMMLMEYDDVIQFETLTEDAERFQRIFGFESRALLPTNRNTRPQDTREDYRTLYDRRTRTIVTRLSRQVIDKFGYVF